MPITMLNNVHSMRLSSGPTSSMSEHHRMLVRGMLNCSRNKQKDSTATVQWNICQRENNFGYIHGCGHSVDFFHDNNDDGEGVS